MSYCECGYLEQAHKKVHPSGFYCPSLCPKCGCVSKCLDNCSRKKADKEDE